MKHQYLFAGILLIGSIVLSPSRVLAEEKLILENDSTRSFSARTLVINKNDHQGNPTLTFGETLNEQLLWESATSQFIFTDDLEIQGTGSGRRLHAQDLLTSSGQVILESTGAYLRAASIFEPNGNGTGVLLDAKAINYPALAISTMRKEAQASDAPHILFGYSNSFDVNLYRQTTDRLRTDDSLWVSNTLSGATVHAQDRLTSSGTLAIEGGFFQNGMTDCDASGNNLLWDASTGMFSCGSSNSGVSQSEADDRYVNQSGDTMTGNLVIADGAALSVSGAIITEGNLTINQDNGAADAILTFGNDLAAETLRFSDTTNGFIFSDDLEVQGTLSGTILFAQNGLSSSGALSVEDNITTASGSLFQPVYGSDDGLVLHLPLSEAGSTQYDRSPYAHDATVTSATCDATNGKYGDGCDFDGTDDLIETTSVSELEGDSTFTASLWIQCNSNAGNAPAFSIRNGTDGNNLFAFYPCDTFSGNGMRLWFNGTNIIDENGVDRTGAWHHYTLVSRSATDHEVYVDGVLTQTSSTSKTLSSTITNISIGSYSTQFFGGSIDEVMVYNRPLSTEEIRTHYLRGKDSSSLITSNVFKVIDTNGDVNLTVNSGGNVGIGATAPDTTLEVVGTISGSTLITDNLNNSQSVETGSVLVSRPYGAPEWQTQTGSLVWFIDGPLTAEADQSATVTMPFDLNVKTVDLKVKGAPGGASIIVDINEGGTTIFSTNPEIDAGATTEDGNHVFSDTVIAEGAEVTIDIDQIGSGSSGSGLTIMLNGLRR